jgi:hypothetical protein
MKRKDGLGVLLLKSKGDGVGIARDMSGNK